MKETMTLLAIIDVDEDRGGCSGHSGRIDTLEYS